MYAEIRARSNDKHKWDKWDWMALEALSDEIQTLLCLNYQSVQEHLGASAVC